MTFGKTYKELEEWHPVFVWGFHRQEDGRWVWLEKIERRRYYGKYWDVWVYRPIKKTQENLLEG